MFYFYYANLVTRNIRIVYLQGEGCSKFNHSPFRSVNRRQSSKWNRRESVNKSKIMIAAGGGEQNAIKIVARFFSLTPSLPINSSTLIITINHHFHWIPSNLKLLLTQRLDLVEGTNIVCIISPFEFIGLRCSTIGPENRTMWDTLNHFLVCALFL